MLAHKFMPTIHYIYFFCFHASDFTKFDRLYAVFIIQGNAHYNAKSHIMSHRFVIRNRTLYFFCVLDKLLSHSSASIIPGYMFDCHNAKQQPLYVALYEQSILLTKIESSGANDVCARCRRASVQQQSLSERRRMCR